MPGDKYGYNITVICIHIARLRYSMLRKVSLTHTERPHLDYTRMGITSAHLSGKNNLVTYVSGTYKQITTRA